MMSLYLDYAHFPLRIKSHFVNHLVGYNSDDGAISIIYQAHQEFVQNSHISDCLKTIAITTPYFPFDRNANELNNRKTVPQHLLLSYCSSRNRGFLVYMKIG
ncbi:hypothetical protein M5K25_025529 [Dendrobium thyrsiflorum]|uniref:Uncharacterized protein n=1 Tax=Dendrobium thyrsiflorum TaxID=117978 RepID=A0ABD0U476_DENTH